MIVDKTQPLFGAKPWARRMYARIIRNSDRSKERRHRLLFGFGHKQNAAGEDAARSILF
jgi:hypothetical protein